MTTLYQLKKDCFEGLKEVINDYRYHEDAVTEMADSYVPVYNSDLVEMLDNDLSLGYLDEWHGGEVESVFDVLQWNIFMELERYCHDELSGYKQCDNCGKWMFEDEDYYYCDECLEKMEDENE